MYFSWKNDMVKYILQNVILIMGKTDISKYWKNVKYISQYILKKTE